MNTTSQATDRSRGDGSTMDRLVKRGRTMERATRERSSEALEDLRSRVDEGVNTLFDSLERSVQTVLERLDLPTRPELERLRSRIRGLDASVVDALRRFDEASTDHAMVLHVVPDDGGWKVEQESEDGDALASHHRTKAKAFDHARLRARAGAPSRIVVHRGDGTIQRHVCYT